MRVNIQTIELMLMDDVCAFNLAISHFAVSSKTNTIFLSGAALSEIEADFLLQTKDGATAPVFERENATNTRI